LKNEIEALKRAVPLVRVVSAKVKLEQRGGEYWGCCPFHNERTASFAIKEKNGEQVFFCQGCGKGGDVVRFIEYIEHCTTKQAIDKLKVIAGNVDWQEGAKKVAETFQSVTEEKPKITVPLEKWPAFEMALEHNKAALDWLQNVRGITLETTKALRLGYAQSVKGRLNPEDEPARDKGWILFPRIEGNNLVACKARSITTKAFSQWANMNPKALFNAETINALEPVFVTEGELDTAVMEQAGFRAVSIPNASTKPTPEIKALLKNAECVYLAGDNDGKVGNAAMIQLQRELAENTYMIVWPGAKDANQYFMEVCGGNVDKFRNHVTALVNKARSTPIVGFTSLIERLRSSGGTDAGKDPHRLHFSLDGVDKMNYNPPGSIVVIYSTYSGTGKTILITQFMIPEAKRGEIVVVYSPEVRDEQYLALVAAQTIGPKRLNGLDRAGFISKDDYEETAQLLDKPTAQGTDFRYYVGHSLPESETDKVLEFIEQTIRVTGATRFVIDTLHRIIDKQGRENQTEAEGRIVKKLEALGIKYGTIFILIGQSNKEAEDLKELRHDSEGVLRGSRELMDVAYGVYLLHRKKKTNADGNMKDLLEKEAKLILKKDRGKGPGAAIVNLVFRPECSMFFEQSHVTEPGATPPMSSANSDGMDADNNFA
jgi:KaiC/GvpD/RAD55 family RecA-like ATPase